MYTKDEMLMLIASDTGLDLDEVNKLYNVYFGDALDVSINSAHLALIAMGVNNASNY